MKRLFSMILVSMLLCLNAPAPQQAGAEALCPQGSISAEIPTVLDGLPAEAPEAADVLPAEVPAEAGEGAAAITDIYPVEVPTEACVDTVMQETAGTEDALCLPDAAAAIEEPAAPEILAWSFKPEIAENEAPAAEEAGEAPAEEVIIEAAAEKESGAEPVETETAGTEAAEAAAAPEAPEAKPEPAPEAGAERPEE